MITQERAKEIMRLCQNLAQENGGLWADQMPKVITVEENTAIKRHWEALPGGTSYMDSFFDFLNGTVGELG